MRQATAPRNAPGHGSGVYRRGNVFWLKNRTPASLANHLSRTFWRSSLRTSSRSEALCAARSARAALDQGLVAVGVGMRLGALTAAQGEAVITALVRRSLAEAETRRALAGPRGEDAIEAARHDHVAEAAAWRDVLRRNDLSTVAPLVTNAAAATGLVDPAQALVPDLLREAARTLAAVAEENVERENGFYAGDRARFLARLDVAPAPRPATRESMVVRARVAQESPPESTWIGAGSVVAEPVLFVRGGSAIDSTNGADLAARAFAEAGAFSGRPQPIDPVRPTSLASKQSSTRSA